ncbi:hypothetical protein FHS83_001722 [Rhizomicrobium palustre]|uniref:Uncharacterized protein n=1 Tax=Rhizomicrobium palustre TaxID=189966 RepID=A0A846MXS8_9PROT|nr:hypothetical protein [Rhizomicrobium palustre]NIK88404.1 hypothetical protein [Rhizomicrobium palustre]
MRLLICMGVFAAAIAGPVMAEENVQQPSEMSTTSEAWLNQTVCKRRPPPTGSRIGGEKVCMTNRQWQFMWSEARHGVDRMQNKPISKGGSGS